MFYDTKLNNHNLKYNPFKSCVIPRPIGWISSQSSSGIVNIAPYSYFNAVSDIPPIIMFSSSLNKCEAEKDSLINIEETGEFVVNIASYNLREKINQSSASLPHNISEAKEFNIETEPSIMIKTPRVKDSLISLECKYLQTISINVEGEKASSKLVLGHVIGIYIEDKIIVDGKIDVTKLKPIARLGYDEYAVINEVFKMNKP